MALYGGITLPGKPDLENIRRLDLLPMPALAEMMHNGMAIDRDWFSDLSNQLTVETKELRSKICSYVPQDRLEEFTARAIQAESDADDAIEADPDAEPVIKESLNVGSTQQLSKLLFDILGIGAGHSLKLTKSGSQISTGKKQLEKFKRDHPIVPLVLDYKERVKLKTAFSDKLPLMARHHSAGNCICGERHDQESYRVHSKILSTRTSTGRLAGKEPNLMQIPTRSDLGRRTRAGFIATPGMDLISVDFSQFEMRLCAHYSQDPNFMRVFREGLDAHTDTAMRAFHKTKEEVMTDQGKLLYRAPCKVVGFGLLYGLTPDGMYDQMILAYSTAGLEIPDWLTLDWCEQFMDDWFDLYPEVRRYMQNQYYRSQRYGIVWTLCGRIRRIPEVRSEHKHIAAGGLRQAGNAPIQGSQADLFKIALALVHDKIVKPIRASGVPCRMLNAVHDEILVEVEQGRGDFTADLMAYVMEEVMRDIETGVDLCSVPIVASSHVMQRWEK